MLYTYAALAAAVLANPGVSAQQAAIAQQQASVRRQAANAGAWLVPWGPPPASAVAEAACDPLADTVVAPLIERAAKERQLDPKLVRAVAEQESALRPCAVSSKGAMGLMQLMPVTIEQLGVRDPFDPSQSIDAGSRYLKELLDRYHGDLAQALGAYNAGPAAVNQAGGIPDIPETRDYVAAILRKLGLSNTAPPNSPKPKPTGN
jgi:soluble lytic murein transglycosylase-like protein